MKNEKPTPGRVRYLLLVLVLAGSLFSLIGCSEDGAGSDTLTTDGTEQEAPNGEALGDGTENLPEIVATVNGQAVTRTEMRRLLDDPLAIAQLQSTLGSKEPGSEELQRAAVEMLIDRRLILEEAARRSITVTDKEVDDAVLALRGRFPDLASFGLWMQQQGINEESLFDLLGDELLATRVREVLVGEVAPTEDEIEEYYEAHKEDLAIGEEVRLRVIAVTSRAEADEIAAALRQGENFAQLARERSVGQRAANGGDTGWVNFQSLPLPLQPVVARLKAGEAGGPFQTGAEEFLIVGLEGRRPVRAKDLAEARPEIARRLLGTKQQEVLEAWLAEQEKKSKIEVLF